MRLTLEQVPGDGTEVRVRFTAYNDSYAPVRLDRRCLVGPHLRPGAVVRAFGVSLEPESASGSASDHEILLNPWCFYGRVRSFGELPSGEITVCGYLTTEPVDSLLPDGPADPSKLAVAADPFVLG